jgi:hypothetical protein
MSNLLGNEEDILSLNNIRNVLIRLEDTIIFCAFSRLPPRGVPSPLWLAASRPDLGVHRHSSS